MCADFHPAKKAKQIIPNLGRQYHVLAGVVACNGWNGTFLTQVGSPIARRGLFTYQTAFFQRPPAEVISEKIGAFRSKRGFHDTLSCLSNKPHLW